jgi:hypothetical protein
LVLQDEVLQKVGVVLDEHVDRMVYGSIVDDQVEFVVVVNRENRQNTFGPGTHFIGSYHQYEMDKTLLFVNTCRKTA